MSEALTLFRLQNLDTQIDTSTRRIQEIDLILSDNKLIQRAEKILKRAEQAAKKVKTELKQIEDKVETTTIKKKTTQAALFGGKIKNPKELQDLQMESEALKRFISKLEDDQLEAMIAFEDAEKMETQARKNLEQAKGTLTEQNAALLGERNKLVSDLERLTREKEAVVQSVPTENLSLYQKLRKLKNGKAVAIVTMGGCSICGQSLTPADQQAVRASNRIVFCPSCGRILYSE